MKPPATRKRRAHTAWTLFVAFVLAFAGVTAPAQAAGSSFDTATPIAVNSTGVAGAITAGGQKDYYTFIATSASVYTVDAYNVSTSMGNLCVAAYDSGRNLVSSQCYNGSSPSSAIGAFDAIAGQRYYIRLSADYSSKTGTYRLRVLPQYDKGLTHDNKGEPNNTLDTAEPITPGITGLARAIEPRNPAFNTNTADRDAFYFSAVPSQTYTAEVFDVASSLGNLCIAVYDSAMNLVSSECYNGSGNVSARAEFDVSLAGTYFIRVSPDYSSQSGTYRVRVLPQSGHGLTWGSDGEPNDTMALAQPQPLGTFRTATIAARNPSFNTQTSDRDYYSISTTAGRRYTVTTSNLTGTIIGQGDLTVYDSAGTSVAYSGYCAEAVGTQCNLVSFDSSLGGTYFVRFDPEYSSQSGTYKLCARVTGQTCTNPPPATVSGYNPLDPVRLLDTRSGLGAAKAPVYGASSVSVQVAGRGGVPSSGVAAVVLNVTAVGPSAGGFVTAWPSGTTRPTASNLNYLAGRVIANQAIVRPGSDGKVTLYTSATTHLLVDVLGYYPTAGGKYVPASPTRIVDTRTGTGAAKATVAGGATLRFKVAGMAAVPSTAKAVALNVTTIGPAAAGYATVWPSGVSKPNASNVNFERAQNIAGFVVVKVGADGYVNFSPSAGANVAVDVAGYFPSTSDLTGITPSRLLDTRTGTGSVGGGQTIAVRVVGVGGVPATNVKAVSLNITAVAPAANGFVTVWPQGTRPTASTVNYTAGRTIANSIVAKVGTDGYVRIYTSARTQIIVDVSAYITR